jgi:2-polyprenyl-3-methyl-5-hydroxy-6-metoxy-1,4-benzoquinol methylase
VETLDSVKQRLAWTRGLVTRPPRQTLNAVKRRIAWMRGPVTRPPVPTPEPSKRRIEWTSWSVTRPPLPPIDPLPTQADDPRLCDGRWSQTIELAPGIVTRNAEYDPRPIVDQVGLPPSLAGKTALDVGTADGFWAFEMERRGADPVIAIDVIRAGEFDILPIHRARKPKDWDDEIHHMVTNFATAQAMRKSRVHYIGCSVYNLSPETLGTFDVVYCGSLLLHLHNPLRALINIRSVTREMAIIETFSLPVDDPVEKMFPDQPYMTFGALGWEDGQPGALNCYWRFTTKALCDMLTYAGFASVEPRGKMELTGPKGNRTPITAVVARV